MVVEAHHGRGVNKSNEIQTNRHVPLEIQTRRDAVGFNRGDTVVASRLVLGLSEVSEPEP